MFVSKAGAYPSGVPTLYVDSWPYQQTLDEAGKALLGAKTLAYYEHS